MGLDFADLVLAPAMDVFAKAVTFTPVVSQPGADPYAARGVWSITDVDIVTDDGGSFSNRTLKLGISLNDYAAAPQQGDLIAAQATDLPLGYWQGAITAGVINFIVDDFRPDGQGGATLILKRQA